MTKPPFEKRPSSEEAETILQDTIQRGLEQSLPSFMVPNTITILNELPITMNGKIDRKALANRGDYPE
jgi:acyl-coenzyme A synthetase/AMP-(fatty) acid ligase